MLYVLIDKRPDSVICPPTRPNTDGPECVSFGVSKPAKAVLYPRASMLSALSQFYYSHGYLGGRPIPWDGLLQLCRPVVPDFERVVWPPAERHRGGKRGFSTSTTPKSPPSDTGVSGPLCSSYGVTSTQVPEQRHPRTFQIRLEQLDKRGNRMPRALQYTHTRARESCDPYAVINPTHVSSSKLSSLLSHTSLVCTCSLT